MRTCVVEYLSAFDPTLAVDLADEDVAACAAAGPGGGDQQSFVARVRGMPQEHFLSCLSMAFEHLLLALGRAGRVHAFLQTSLGGLLALAGGAEGEGAGEGGGVERGGTEGERVGEGGVGGEGGGGGQEGAEAEAAEEPPSPSSLAAAVGAALALDGPDAPAPSSSSQGGERGERAGGEGQHAALLLLSKSCLTQVRFPPPVCLSVCLSVCRLRSCLPVFLPLCVCAFILQN